MTRIDRWKMTRRLGLVLATAALVAGCSSGASKPAEGDMALGADEGAKVTVVEYASVTCHVCAAWQEETWPAFKARYVDTKKVRYVFRELPTPPVEVATAGFLVARCAGPDKYFDVVHQLLATQQEIGTGGGPRAWLLRTANAVGINEQQFEQCVRDTQGIEAMEGRIRAAQAAGATGTPAFFVNGVQVITPGGNGPSIDDLSRAIEAELAK
ncbi:MAG TPA: thioredoxin domain-containing protein [Brevundimonas sp.]|uniref:thioredoxin domain-containing protein n=1 Tax=Brevundimonas sp. TaxID=1871086 RepID=UPI0026268587|nr:thioredoxin domain-containing protein [Brevundimonas sp.]HRO33405.1 thioredoxin domain-containing protein [Brevundimonas sp.]